MAIDWDGGGGVASRGLGPTRVTGGSAVSHSLKERAGRCIGAPHPERGPVGRENGDTALRPEGNAERTDAPITSAKEVSSTRSERGEEFSL